MINLLNVNLAEISKNVSQFFKGNKVIFYVLIFALFVVSSLIIFCEEFLKKNNLNTDLIKPYDSYIIGIWFFSLVLVLCAVFVEIINFFSACWSKKALLENLTQIGSNQKRVLIECYRKKARFFNYNTLGDLYKKNQGFMSMGYSIDPLIDSKIVKKSLMKNVSSYEIEKVIWNKLERSLPSPDDLTSYWEVSSIVLPENIKYFLDVDYTRILIEKLNSVIKSDKTIKDIHFSNIKANTHLTEIKKCLKTIKDELESRRFLYLFNNEFFTIYQGDFIGSEEQQKEIGRVITACKENAQTLIAHLESLQTYFDCENRLK